MGLYRIGFIACLLSCQIVFGNDRECVVNEGKKLTHVREDLSNDSKEIRTILKHAGFDNPAPYCSATVKYIFDLCGVLNEITAWSPSAVPENKAVWKSGKAIKREPMMADTWGVYSPRKGRVSHAGIVFHWPEDGNYFLSFEGNVRVSDGREGITILRRKKSDVYIVANWIEDEVVREKVNQAIKDIEDIPVEQAKEADPPTTPKKIKEIVTLILVIGFLMRYGNER